MDVFDQILILIAFAFQLPLLLFFHFFEMSQHNCDLCTGIIYTQAITHVDRDKEIYHFCFGCNQWIDNRPGGYSDLDKDTLLEYKREYSMESSEKSLTGTTFDDPEDISE